MLELPVLSGDSRNTGGGSIELWERKDNEVGKR